MGEVGAALPEKQTESPTVNGDINGVCKTNVQMDVDTEEDSQISSENGISDISENNINKKLEILKTDTLIKTDIISKDDKISNHSAENSKDNEEITPEKLNSNNSDNNENINNLTENGLTGSKENENQIVPTVSGKIEENTSEELTKENGDVNGSLNVTKLNDSDEIQIIESDEDDDDDDGDDGDDDDDEDDDGEDDNEHDNIEKSNATSESLTEKSELKISLVQERVEQMNVDSTTNGSLSKKQNLINRSDEDDDDAAVIIHSDSDGDYDDDSQEKKSNSSKNTEQSTAKCNEKTDIIKNNVIDKQDDEIEEILSDKDDCVVIEDDDKKDKNLSLRRTNRQRKSVVKVRDFSEFDDDVTEILEDSPTGQPPAKRQRTSTNSSTVANSGNLPQVGQITIKDARSLMGSFVENSQKQTFQQQFIQATGNKGTKEPTLVIIDTNTIMKDGTSPTNTQNAPKPNFSVVPVGLPAQGPFPVSIRPALAPLSNSPKIVAGSATNTNSPPTSNSILLPALTDDMFVLEAPSFIVPYIYEKPPPDNLKEVVSKMEVELEKIKKEIQNKLDESKELEALKNIKTEGVDDDKKNDSKKRKKGKNPDDSWDESDTSTDDEASDKETRTKVLIKEVKEDLDTIKAHIITPDLVKDIGISDTDKKPDNYFESPLGKFFIDIGIGLVQEYVQTDLLRQQRRKRERVGKAHEVEIAINALKKNLETSRKRNEPFKFEMKRCEYCNFKSESALAMAHHYETPHMRQYLYKCNFCPFEIRPPHDILFHMEAVHNIKGRLEKAPSYHQCPNCPFEDNGKSKLARHTPVCAKKFNADSNLQPPHDWEAPAKIPRIKPRHGLVGTATAYQAMAAQAAAQKAALTTMASRGSTTQNNNAALMRNRGRPQLVTRSPATGGTVIRANQPLRPQIPGMVLPNNYQIAGGQLIQVAGSSLAILPNSHSSLTLQQHNAKKSAGQQPSISITPLPRQPGGIPNSSSLQAASIASVTKQSSLKPGQTPTGGGKASFVICEICDGYIKDLEQLRNHMQWMHKVKIHPKMIYNRPPLNCQKCQFRFFTDQGLERHLLGSHGLVTSSMQEAANKGKDAGRCPVCGRMYQWKLLNHVSRDHHMTLKPAHLSYKCTVCTATFGMYKQFENHVYTAHSTVAKKAMDGKKGGNNNNSNSNMAAHSSGGASSNKANISSLTGGDSLLKPLKINDEITIIPQPATKSRGGSNANDYESHIIGKFFNRK